MNPARLMTRPVTILHRAVDPDELDEMGNPTTVETSFTVLGDLQQTQRDEVDTNADVQRSRWTLFLEPAAAGRVDGSDIAVVSGAAYQFDGPPWEAWNPRLRRVTHLEASVRRTV
jgi:hypothetical protein